MKTQLNHLCIIFSIILFSSCASISGFEEARSLGEGNSELIVSGNYTRIPDLFGDELDIFNNISFFNVEANYKYGINDKLDIGIKASSNVNLGGFIKYQLIGNELSKFALGTGLEIGTVYGLTYNIGVPIYTTFYPNENIAINLSPRIIYQQTLDPENSGRTYLGGNFGVLFGTTKKFGIDIGYYDIDIWNENRTLITFGIGGKFRLDDLSNKNKIGD